MEPSYSKTQQNIPPLQSTIQLGTLHYVDGNPGGTPIKFEINGTIDKGFFLAENEWTCYRRNYFSCVCSFTLNPPPPNWSTNPPQIQFVQSSSNTTYHVNCFAMCISAVVSENDSQTIDLVQHTPKRDKGPTTAPEKVRLQAKPATSHPMAMFSQADAALRGPGYDGSSFGPTATEHTFERIQFKQATANNGKRRAAQQYYHLVIELWADVGNQPGTGNPEWVKVGYRKSAKMIVRGRSPGHYQTERRTSTSNGPGGSAGNLGYGNSQVIGSDFTPGGAGMLSAPYGGTTYDPRTGSHYSSGTRHQQQDMNIDTIMSGTDEHKTISESKDYHYYPSTIYENSQDARQPVEMFSHQTHQGPGHRGEQESSSSADTSKVKQEYDGTFRSVYYPGSYYNRVGGNCGRYDSKPTSNGLYPTMIPPTGINMTT